MSNDENTRRNVDAFWSAIEPGEGAYTNDSFTYIAVKSPEGFRRDCFLMRKGLYRFPLHSNPPMYELATSY
jgi:hypothetical protein